MKKQKLIVRQLKKIREIAMNNIDKNPEHFRNVIKAIDETLNEIHLEQLAEIEALELSMESVDGDFDYV